MTVLTTALASFLAVLAMMTARVYNGTDPGLAPTAAVVSHKGQAVLRTTASGRVISSAPASSGLMASQKAPLVTHTSGSLAGGGRDE
jgi:hypothetical protein